MKSCVTFAAVELGQGEFGSVMKGTWLAPSGNLVQTSYVARGLGADLFCHRKRINFHSLLKVDCMFI